MLCGGAFTEDISSVPRPTSGSSKMLIFTAPEDPMLPSGLFGQPHSLVHTHTNKQIF